MHPLPAFPFTHNAGAATAPPRAADVAAAKTAGANQAIIQADGNDIRYRIDGSTTAPTAAVGVLLKNGTSMAFNMADALTLRFIQVAATAVVNAIYTM